MSKKRLEQIDTILDLLQYILICSVIVVIIFTIGIRHSTVVGNSMYPTLKNDEHVLINVAASYMDDINRFDVVVAKNKENNDLWVKRVIALPNETVEYHDDQLYINGKAMEETFLNKQYIKNMLNKNNVETFTTDVGPYTLKNDEYFLVGDNRVNSADSRIETVGPFKRNQIIAKGMMIIYPFDEIRYID